MKASQYLNRPHELKAMMLIYMSKYPRSMGWYATQVGISWHTLSMFLNKDTRANSGTLTKIIKFLNDQGVIDNVVE